ncbi:hypothetical protein AK812_SmicGene26272 [Symbiodinium microadriaticum]|uniref:Uncharacterized protein n=1 Tax=Symbiodinium microadriaticum TaxID=2951 RepID=A0A1Q9D9U2_SYMMI|nr:hypothetical protein AK812_SmicGene26272 [Symbiodinium microadriaticum]
MGTIISTITAILPFPTNQRMPKANHGSVLSVDEIGILEFLEQADYVSSFLPLYFREAQAQIQRCKWRTYLQH